METPKLLIPALRQYRNNNGEGLVVGYDNELTDQIVVDLLSQIIDLKACLRTCANSANGALNQYNESA